jgi:hypothetical protein
LLSLKGVSSVFGYSTTKPLCNLLKSYKLLIQFSPAFEAHHV